MPGPVSDSYGGMPPMDVTENIRGKIEYATEKSRPTHMCSVDDLQAFLAEVERLQRWVADLQSGMYVNCVYCGHRYGPGETTPVSMADALKAHVAKCHQHPMSGLLKALKAMLDTHGKPQREEWINDAALEHARAVDAQARAAIAAVDPGWVGLR